MNPVITLEKGVQTSGRALKPGKIAELGRSAQELSDLGIYPDHIMNPADFHDSCTSSPELLEDIFSGYGRGEFLNAIVVSNTPSDISGYRSVTLGIREPDNRRTCVTGFLWPADGYGRAMPEIKFLRHPQTAFYIVTTDDMELAEAAMAQHIERHPANYRSIRIPACLHEEFRSAYGKGFDPDRPKARQLASMLVSWQEQPKEGAGIIVRAYKDRKHGALSTYVQPVTERNPQVGVRDYRI